MARNISVCGSILPASATTMLPSAIESHWRERLNLSSVPNEYAVMRKMNSMMTPGTSTVLRYML